jgi:hypothetical protein
MAVFCVMRKQFLDRAFDLAELQAFAEMLRKWYLIDTGNAGHNGQLRCHARVYAIPRNDREMVRQSLSARLHSATFDETDADELGITGPASNAGTGIDVTIWQAVLSDPKLGHACLLLRMTIQGPAMGMNGILSEGTTSFVLCGAPANGAMLVKAIWKLGADEYMHAVYRAAPWPEEQRLLETFEFYLQQQAPLASLDMSDSAARLAFSHFCNACPRLFMAKRDERRVKWLVRHRVELPDDRGPAAFLRRAGLPLLAGIILAFVPILYPKVSLLTIGSVLGACYLLWSAARITWQKLQRIRRYRTGMRLGLGKLYSGPANYQQIDLSHDQTPTLLKCVAEIEALGAHHVCDICVTTGLSVLDGNRVYTLGDATWTIGLLRRTEGFLCFPARSVLIAATRFTDGRRHYTFNRPRARKISRPQITARCMLTGGVDEMLAMHRRHVDRLIASGAVPLPRPTTGAQVIERMQREHEEGREIWKSSPYSWGDALHDAFKICRREFLRD